MWRTRFDQRGVRLPPAARQLLRGGMLVGLICVCVCVCVCVCSRPHRAPPHFTDMPGTVRRPMQCPTERETIYSTMQFNSLNSQMKLYLSVLTLSGWGGLDSFLLNLDIRSFVFLKFRVEIFSVYVHWAGRQKTKKKKTQKKQNQKKKKINLSWEASFESVFNSVWSSVGFKCTPNVFTAV